MKRTAFRVMIAAAAAMAAVATASAQGMKAEIPFPFQAAGARMQPGTYWVTLNRGTAGVAIHISNLDTRKSVISMSRSTSAPPTFRESKPVLTFACSGPNCVLSSLRDDSSNVYGVSMGKNQAGARIATVILKSDRAE
jgi:hypothetical protein